MSEKQDPNHPPPDEPLRHKRQALHERMLGGHEHILVVDDKRIITKATTRLLERYGYHTLTAGDGREALACYQQHGDSVDLILLDMEMPEMGGMECLARLRIFDPDVRVVILSGHHVKSHRSDPLKAGARAFIEKPCDNEHLLEVVRRVLDEPACPPHRQISRPPLTTHPRCRRYFAVRA
jgi:CheY-like chemotaxis protein